MLLFVQQCHLPILYLSLLLTNPLISGEIRCSCHIDGPKKAVPPLFRELPLPLYKEFQYPQDLLVEDRTRIVDSILLSQT